MAILVYRNNRQEGPYEIEELRQALVNGTLSTNDLAWRDGMADWTPLGDMLAFLQTSGASVRVKTDPLSIWSLVLGILSWVCLSIIAGIPAIICGHLSLNRQKTNEILQGKGMAIAGLVLGYASIAVFFVLLLALALPAVSGASNRAKEVNSLNSARQIALAIQAAALDTFLDEKKDIGWPADAGLKSAADVEQRLFTGNYLTRRDLEKIRFENFLIGNVAEKDPGDTILVKSKAPIRGASVIVLKNGEGFVLREGKPGYGMDPPRDPAFLD
jgi:hypothetical protein